MGSVSTGRWYEEYNSSSAHLDLTVADLEISSSWIFLFQIVNILNYSDTYMYIYMPYYGVFMKYFSSMSNRGYAVLLSCLQKIAHE